MEEVTITTFITIAVMLLFSAFFSGMEIAFLGRNRLREEIDRKQNPLFNHIADIFARNSSNYITTILVGNNIALVIYSMFMSKMLLNGLNIENTLLQTILSTIVIIFIGEYIPKSIVRHNPNFYYTHLSPIIYLIYIIMKRSRIILAVIGVLSFVGCSDEVEYIWDEESRINEYANWIDDTICRNVVDNLDFMFQTSAYRDSLRNGGDVNAVIERQFSNPHIAPP